MARLVRSLAISLLLALVAVGCSSSNPDLAISEPESQSAVSDPSTTVTSTTNSPTTAATVPDNSVQIAEMQAEIDELTRSNEELREAILLLADRTSDLDEDRDALLRSVYGSLGTPSISSSTFGIEGDVEVLQRDITKLVTYINCLADSTRLVSCLPPQLGI